MLSVATDRKGLACIVSWEGGREGEVGRVVGSYR